MAKSDGEESSGSGNGKIKRFSTTSASEVGEDVVVKQPALPPPPPPDEEGDSNRSIRKPLLPAPVDIARASGQLVKRANAWFEATIASASASLDGKGGSWVPSDEIKACLKPLAHEDGNVDANGVAILGYRQRSLETVEQSSMSTAEQRACFMEKLQLVRLLAKKLPVCRPAGLDHYYHEMQDLRDETLLEIAMHCRTRINPIYDQDAVIALVVEVVDLMALSGRDYATFNTEARRHPSNDEGPDERGSDFSREDLMLLSAAHHLWQLVLQGGAQKATKNAVITESMLSRTVQTMDSPDWGERDMLVTSMHQVYAAVHGSRKPMRQVIRQALLEVPKSDVELSARPMMRGVPHILSLLNAILAGTKKFKNEHERLLVETLLPLHASPVLQLFHEQLCACVAIYLRRDPTCITTIIQGLCRCWRPLQSKHELLLLEELQAVCATFMPQVDDAEQLRAATALVPSLFMCLSDRASGTTRKKALMFLSVDTIRDVICKEESNCMRIVAGLRAFTEEGFWWKEVVALADEILTKYRDVGRSRGWTELDVPELRKNASSISGRSRSISGLGAGLALEEDEEEHEHHHDHDAAHAEFKTPNAKDIDHSRLSAELAAPHLHKELHHDREVQKQAARTNWRQAAMKMRALSILGTAFKKGGKRLSIKRASFTMRGKKNDPSKELTKKGGKGGSEGSV
jgi:hypothetical protein